ncbi:MAG: glutamate racemase [Atopobiaceae bacterium]|nr:glutamate racemase [Atopobiaceae bacterium]
MTDGVPHPLADGFVGVFDSGVGGVSVLQHLVRELPGEDFRYFGDSAHAPYGGKSADEVYRLSRTIADRMLADGAKALVIACNTATSAAAAQLREAYPQVPVVGVEPALKPAVLAGGSKKVLVMATEVTLALDKFHQLEERWAQGAQVVPVACGGLVECVERGDLDDPSVIEVLERLVGRYRGEVDRVVLGCTHYPFVRTQIAQVLGDVTFFDGGAGTARQLRRLLEQDGLLRDGDQGVVSFSSSIDTPAELALYRRFFEMPC